MHHWTDLIGRQIHCRFYNTQPLLISKDTGNENKTRIPTKVHKCVSKFIEESKSVYEYSKAIIPY